VKSGFFPWEVGVLMVAVDPAQLRSAVALRGQAPDGSVQKILLRADDIADIRVIMGQIEAFAQGVAFSRVFAVVEYPTWGGHGTYAVRAAANAFIRLLKEAFPRKLTVVKVDPKDWQKQFSFRDRPKGHDTKEYSFWLADKAYGWAPETPDEADAALMLEYGRTLARAVPAKKKAAKKKP
jgi:hypothetical protein